MKKTVLIVDDNHNNLQLAGSVLNPYYRLMLADSGEKALKTVELKRPDIILLDVMMPGLSGYDVCKILKTSESTRDIPVIFLTAKSEEDDIEMGFDAGGADYVTKPFKAKEILARIKTQMDLVTATKALQERNGELEKLIANRDRFFSIISHDLRSPLSAMMGLTGLLVNSSESFDDNERAEHLQVMHESLTNVFTLVENLLLWSKSQRNILDYKPTEILISDVITECISEFQLKASQKEIKLQSNVDKTLTGYTDKNIIKTVLRNLISNAIKFSHRGDAVHIESRLIEGPLIEIIVRDNGIGIIEKDIEKLFKINEKVSRPGTEEEPSSGLGLLLCKEYVEKQGGAIGVESIAGEGSVFHFTIPATRQDIIGKP